MIKFRTLILIFCLLVVATTTTIFALKSKPDNTPNIYVPAPVTNVSEVLPDAVTISPPVIVDGRYNGYPTYEMYQRVEVLNFTERATVPDSWIEIKRNDLGISMKLPEDYKDLASVNATDESYLNLTLDSVTVSTGYGYFPGGLYSNEEKAKLNPSFLSSGLKVYLAEDTHQGGDNNMVAAIELPYLVEQRYLYFQFRLNDLAIFSKIVKGINRLPVDTSRYKEKIYTNTELGFKTRFPIPRNTMYSLSESFLPGPKGSFHVGFEEGTGLINGIGKDYVCECDAYFIQSFPKSSELFPVQQLTNKYGVQYGIMTSNFRVEDDELGEALHVGEKIYIIKTKNKDFPVLTTVRITNAFDESIAKFIVDSFELI